MGLPKIPTHMYQTRERDISKSTFKRSFHPTQHKSRRIPLHIIEKRGKELKKLMDEKQIRKLDKCSDEFFISPVVITVKYDKPIKIALDSKKLIDAIHKNKFRRTESSQNERARQQAATKNQQITSDQEKPRPYNRSNQLQSTISTHQKQDRNEKNSAYAKSTQPTKWTTKNNQQNGTKPSQFDKKLNEAAVT